MNLNDAIQKLQAEPLTFEYRTAVAYARAEGRCEYCNTPVIFDRRYYASAQIDHLLTRKYFSSEVTDLEYNFVLSCGLCNSLKHFYIPSPIKEKENLGDAELADYLIHNRCALIEDCRSFIKRKRKRADKQWRAARCIFAELDRDLAPNCDS